MNDTRAAEVAERLLSTADLAARWGETNQTQRLRRMRGDGPPYIRVGRKALYKLSSVEAYEAGREFRSTSDESTRKGA